jgi:RimK family alpha-L-glutamate ligase
VPGGSLEQVVLYLDILHAFEHQSVRVYNNVRSIERSVDKAMTSYLLQVSDIPTPPTWAGSDIHQAYQFLREGLLQGHRYVLKPLFGSQGKGLQLIQNLNDIQNLSAFQGVYYIQQFISPGTSCNKDWRLFVIGDQVLASMCREGEGWISNVAHGARCTTATLPAEVEQMAVRACQVVGADYAGVDVMLNPDNQYVVTEVNSVPAWKGLQGVTPYNIADCIVDHFLSVINQACAERPHLVQV